jgi:hypothetical protein
MLKSIKNPVSVLCMAAMLTIGFSSCKKNNTPEVIEPETENTYSLRVLAGSPASSYLVQTGSLSSGIITTAGNGVATNLTTITTKNGFYYGLDNDSGNLIKYTSNNKTNTIVKEIPFKQISWAFYSSFYKWKDEKTLVLFSSNAAIQFEYAILNVETMTITSSGNINVPGLKPGYYFWGYNAAFVGEKLYLTYTQSANSNDISDRTTYLAAMDYPAMNNVVVSQDTRFGMPQHYTLHMQGSFTDNGNAYFLASPNIWTSGDTDLPFGIYRVKGGTTQIDPDYFYELTDRAKEEALGLFHIGNGKAIVKILDRTKITSSSSYNTLYITEYYVVDVVNKTKTKINIPKSIAVPFSQNVMVNNGIVHIGANTPEGMYIYQYNINTGAVTRGAKVDGANTIERLDLIK